MKVRAVHHTSGVVNQITVKLTKRDMAKVVVLMSAVTCIASLPVGYVRRNLIDEAVQRLEDASARRDLSNLRGLRDEDA